MNAPGSPAPTSILSDAWQPGGIQKPINAPGSSAAPPVQAAALVEPAGASPFPPYGQQNGPGSPLVGNPNFGQQNGPGYPMAAPAQAATAKTPLDAGGYENPGAYLPGLSGQGNAGIERLLQDVLKTTSAKDMQGQMRDLNIPRSVSFTRAPEGSLASFNAAGGHFTPESDAELQQRQLKTLFGLDQMAGGNDKLNLERLIGVSGSVDLPGGKLGQAGDLARGSCRTSSPWPAGRTRARRRWRANTTRPCSKWSG